jgi:DNA-binding response OmpR family regulator
MGWRVSGQNGGLAGLRVLVAEDETPLAMEIVEVFKEQGCVIVGPVAKLEDAVAAAESEPLDWAILDVNLRGGHVFPAAEALLRRGIAFIFATGYEDLHLFPDHMRAVPRLEKPYGMNDLIQRARVVTRGRR